MLCACFLIYKIWIAIVTTCRVVLKITWTIQVECLEEFLEWNTYYVKISYHKRLFFNWLQLLPSLSPMPITKWLYSNSLKPSLALLFALASRSNNLPTLSLPLKWLSVLLHSLRIFHHRNRLGKTFRRLGDDTDQSQGSLNWGPRKTRQDRQNWHKTDCRHMREQQSPSWAQPILLTTEWWAKQMALIHILFIF